MTAICMYCDDPNDQSYAIVTEDEYGEVTVTFFLHGVTSYFNTLTSFNLTRDPNSSVYE